MRCLPNDLFGVNVASAFRAAPDKCGGCSLAGCISRARSPGGAGSWGDCSLHVPSLPCDRLVVSLAPKASADRVVWCALDGLPASIRWRSLRPMAAVGGRCYTTATRLISTLSDWTCPWVPRSTAWSAHRSRHLSDTAKDCIAREAIPEQDRNFCLHDTRGMTWSFERIKNEWLGDAVVRHSPAELVRLFDIVEATFGLEWMHASRGTGDATGAHPTLHIAATGQLIEATVDLRGQKDLLARLRSKEPGSRVELLVIAIIRATNPKIKLTLAPCVAVGTKTRRPDLRLDYGGEHVYVEVSAAQSSEEAQEVMGRIEEIAQRALGKTPWGNTSEICLHREPSDDEVGELVSAIEPLCSKGDEQVLHGELANVVVNSCEPTRVVFHDHGAIPRPRPRLSIVRGEVAAEKKRHAVVRYPYSDERAAKFLSDEAQQLPRMSLGSSSFT